MSNKDFQRAVGKTVLLRDPRTDVVYTAIIQDAKESYGKLRIRVATPGCEDEPGKWFEPTNDELGLN